MSFILWWNAKNIGVWEKNIYIQYCLELNKEYKLNDKELFVQILTTKHCDFIVKIAKFIQKAMVKRKVFK